MPVTCSVITCNYNNLKNEVRFFSFPKLRKNSIENNRWLIFKRASKWLKACGSVSKPNMRVCGSHFVKGEPADLDATDDIDWVPTLLLPGRQNTTFNETTTIADSGNDDEYDIYRKRELEEEQATASLNLPLDYQECVSIQTQPVNLRELDSAFIIRLVECWEVDNSFNDSGISDSHQDDISDDNTTFCSNSFKENVCTQTNNNWIQEAAENVKERDNLVKENNQLRHTIDNLRKKLSVAEDSTRYSVTLLENVNNKCNYITGISYGRILRHLYEAVKNDLPKLESSEIQERMFILALRKIRLNEPFYTLGLTYNLHHSTVADKVFQVIHSIYPFMSGLVKWPSRDVLKKHMPLSFREKYGDRVTIILDCFEIPMESPKCEEMIANANVYSFYKYHETVKIIAGITPAGCYAFISEAFGGRISDKQIVSMSGILDYIQEGDFVMADRGFLINDLLAQKKADLTIPAFKKANKQLQPIDACDSKELSSLRIHVERLIGSLRQKILMLTDTIPITTLQRWNNGMPALDQIIKIAAGIVNICPSIVPQ